MTWLGFTVIYVVLTGLIVAFFFYAKRVSGGGK